MNASRMRIQREDQCRYSVTIVQEKLDDRSMTLPAGDMQRCITDIVLSKAKHRLEIIPSSSLPSDWWSISMREGASSHIPYRPNSMPNGMVCYLLYRDPEPRPENPDQNTPFSFYWWGLYFIRQRLLEKLDIPAFSSIVQRIDQLFGTFLNWWNINRSDSG